ncbi:hypothetical protein JJD41_07360 [Oxynema sp. CENA135]|uniref:hypothetical protein n=1 Tax=Oxynema sp. CENA135 TaxID=984206 RepID=UPI00190B3B34|nr:hypothetical protein [Oxynema sp. CENA135]MBK4729685.1 hypothetical protein [Oxynema sp. CENA135]
MDKIWIVALVTLPIFSWGIPSTLASSFDPNPLANESMSSIRQRLSSVKKTPAWNLPKPTLQQARGETEDEECKLLGICDDGLQGLSNLQERNDRRTSVDNFFNR